MSIVILFLIGLAIGSFLNVIIWRYKPDDFVLSVKNISGRSHCPYCGKKLEWFELIPIFSFLVQGGKCRSCRHSLSWQYPVVEILSGLIVAGVPYYLSQFYSFAGYSLLPTHYLLIALWVLVFLIWLVIAFIDLRRLLIPNELNSALIILGIAITVIIIVNKNLLFPFSDSFLREFSLIFSPFPQNIFLNHILGAVIGGAVFGLIFWLGRGRAMGLGDVKLAFASGLILSWPDVGLAMVLSFILGGVLGGVLLLSGKKKMSDKIPFGPIFIIGSVLTVFFGSQIIGGYFQLFGFY